MWVWCTLGGWAVHSVVHGDRHHTGVVLVVLAFVVVVFIGPTYIVSVDSTHLSYFREFIKRQKKACPRWQAGD